MRKEFRTKVGGKLLFQTMSEGMLFSRVSDKSPMKNKKELNILSSYN